MVELPKGRFSLPDDTPCPNRNCLRDLIEGELPDPQQTGLIAHLDTCPSCQRALEEVAGGPELCQTVSESLGKDQPVREPGLQQVMASLRTGESFDRSSDALESPEQTLDFLAPCEKSDRIGRLDRYEIIEVLGRGGMGMVLKAFDPSLERMVAIKVLASPRADHADARKRFRREARAAAAVRSEHVVSIYAVEDAADPPYLVMEYVQGQSLQQRLDGGGPLAVDEIVRITRQTAAGLATAHKRGLIHRDVKPGNILIEAGTEKVKLSDFGLARAVDDTSLTQDGRVAGTPEYMAPEQAQGGSVDHRADLFSFGSVLYTMCTGRPPFKGDNTLAVLRSVTEDTPPPIRQIRPEIPEWLESLVEKLHRKDPQQRCASAAEVLDQLKRQEAPSPQPASGGRRRRGGRWLLAATLLVAIVGLGVSEVAGWTHFASMAATLLRIRTPEGTLVVEVDDPNVNVSVDGNQVVLTGAGIEEIRVRPGEHRVVATRDGKPIHDEIVTVTRDGRRVVSVSQESLPADADTTVARAGSGQSTQGPLQVRVVTPESQWREAIQAEKDQLEEEPSPFLVRKFEGHTGPVSGVAFTPDGKTILSCSGWPQGDQTLRQWNVANGEQIRKFDTSAMPKNPGLSGGREAPGEFKCLAVTPDGSRVITGAVGGAVCVWNLKSGKLMQQFEGHDGTVYGIAISSDGRRALSGGRDLTARLWDIQTGEELLRLPGHKSWVRSVAISPDGRFALTGSYDNTLRLWNLETGWELRNLESNKQWVWSVAFSPDGKQAVSASGNVIHLWDLEEAEVIRQFKGHLSGVTSVAFSPDGTRLLSGSYDQTVRLWDVETGDQLQVFLGHRGYVWSVAFSPNGHQAVSAGGGRHTAGGAAPGTDFALRLWKLP